MNLALNLTSYTYPHVTENLIIICEGISLQRQELIN
jgi:hypothetical protein